MAGIADTRGDAIARALDRFRELPAYERLREPVLAAGRLKDEFSTASSGHSQDEARAAG
jgi:hypothetical protein